MAMKAVGRETCTHPHPHPTPPPTSALLGLQWLPLFGVVARQPRRGCELKGDTPWRWPIFSGPKFLPFFQIYQAPLLSLVYLEGSQVCYEPPLFFGPSVPACCFGPRPGSPAQPYAPLGMMVIGFIPTMPRTGLCLQ